MKILFYTALNNNSYKPSLNLHCNLPNKNSKQKKTKNFPQKLRIAGAKEPKSLANECKQL